MNEYTVYGITLPDAYHNALSELRYSGNVVYCEDWKTHCLEVGMTMIVYNPLREPRISRMFPGGFADLEQYRQEILDGILDFETENGNWAYTYHDRMRDQLPIVIEMLKKNPASRRAVITIREPWDLILSDPPCLNHIQFQIRNGKLDMQVLFRSNDAVQAAFMNAFALTCLQERVAKELGVKVGQYVHRVNNFHAYEKDWKLLESYVDREEICGEETTYNYKGDWEELMREAQPEIAAKVERLKNQV